MGKRRGHIINSELIERERCHESCQTVDHFKIAYKTGFGMHCLTFWQRIYILFALLKPIIKLVCLLSVWKVVGQQANRMEGE